MLTCLVCFVALFVMCKQRKCLASGCAAIVRVQNKAQRRRCPACAATHLAQQNVVNAAQRQQQEEAGELLAQLSTDDQKEEPMNIEETQVSETTFAHLCVSSQQLSHDSHLMLCVWAVFGGGLLLGGGERADTFNEHRSFSSRR